jgi:hypothetical protein
MKFIIITGISGAGKSLVAKYLEDLGFFCVDNLPPALISKFAEICLQSGGKMDKIALVIDIRGGELLKDFFPALNGLKDAGFPYEIFFMEKLAGLLGIKNPPSLLFLFGLLYLIIYNLHITTVVSKQSEKITRLAQEIAILKAQKNIQRK